MQAKTLFIYLKPMLLNNILLRNFRNYVDCEVSFPKPVNLILGGNAQGKTSLLEAIYFLCTAESHRATRDGELIRHTAPGFYLKGVLTNSRNGVISLEASKRAQGQFKLIKNGVLQAKRSGWIGQFNAVLFAPESLILVKGAPAERRRFLDLLLTQIDDAYLQHLQHYQFVLKQRNALLKQIRTAFSDIAPLDAWDTLLIAHGAAITQKRLHTFHVLKKHTMRTHQKLTGGQESVTLTHRSAALQDPVSAPAQGERGVSAISEGEITEQFRQKLKASRAADLQRGTTLVGPHRDDFTIELERGLKDGVLTEERVACRESARAYGSQGQQRTIALALKLAELHLIREATGTNPIVLLDDVTSELDNTRIRYLLSVLQTMSSQTFITATHAEPLISHLHEANILTVKNAEVRQTAHTIG